MDERGTTYSSEQRPTDPVGSSASGGSGVGGSEARDPGLRFNPAGIVARVIEIVNRPKTVWSDVREESSPLRDFMKFYVLPLIAIPVVCDFIWATILGRWTPLFRFRSPFFATLYHHIIQYGAQVATLLALAYVLQWLAPRFQGETTMNRTTRLLAYSMSPAWVLGLVALTGSTSLVLLAGLLSLYGLYLFYQGVSVISLLPTSLVYNLSGCFILKVSKGIAMWHTLKNGYEWRCRCVR